jgi:hypothetical protein
MLFFQCTKAVVMSRKLMNMVMIRIFFSSVKREQKTFSFSFENNPKGKCSPHCIE